MPLISKCLFFTGAFAVLMAGRTYAELKVEFDEDVLRVEGATPGGEVALLSVWNEMILDGPYSKQTNIEELLTDDDTDGVVEYTAERTIPTPSIWGVIDTKTGETAVAAPQGFDLRTVPLGKDVAFGKALGRVLVKRTELQVLVVRPEVGVWRGRARDGVDRDVDGRIDHGVTLDLDMLDADKPGNRDPKIAAGDSVIAIDPINMEVVNLRLE